MEEKDWKEKLTEEQYHVLREKGTERAFTGKYDIHFADGAYHCAGCNTKLFDSGSKYDSGCGWPAFYKTADEGAVVEKLDKTFGMVRTEVLSAAIVADIWATCFQMGLPIKAACVTVLTLLR